MCFFRKKNSSAIKNGKDRDLIAQNSKVVDTLIAMTEDDGLKNELKELQEKLKYLIASPEDKVYGLDGKIAALLGDMKIALTKNEAQSEKVKSILKDIKMTVADRNSIV